LILIGILAGFLSGLLGIGGGLLFVPLQYFLLQSVGVSNDIAILVSFGTSLAIIVPTSISSAYKHNKDLNGILNPGVKLGCFGLIGGFFGGLMASYLSYQFLELFFAVILIIIAIYNLFHFKNSNNHTLKLNKLLIIIIGVFVGFLSGLLGIGGGIFLIIILNLFLHFSMRKSIGISSIFISFTAIGGVSSYILTGLIVNVLPYSIGYINLVHFITICLFSIPFAYIGAKISDSSNEKVLKLIFTIIILFTSLKMMGVF